MIIILMSLLSFLFFRAILVLVYIHTGYYMTAWGSEIALRVLKNISRVSVANE